MEIGSYLTIELREETRLSENSRRCNAGFPKTDKPFHARDKTSLVMVVGKLMRFAATTMGLTIVTTIRNEGRRV
jgi:hypothetical protein